MKLSGQIGNGRWQHPAIKRGARYAVPGTTRCYDEIQAGTWNTQVQLTSRLVPLWFPRHQSHRPGESTHNITPHWNRAIDDTIVFILITVNVSRSRTILCLRWLKCFHRAPLSAPCRANIDSSAGRASPLGPLHTCCCGGIQWSPAICSSLV